MKHLALLAVMYVLVAALVLPSALFAADQPQPATAAAAPTATAPATTAPATTAPAPTTTAPVPAAPAPAPTPAATATPPPAPAETMPAPDPVQGLDDGDVQGPPKARAAASASVTISDFQFGPASVTVNVGDTVSWTNQGPTAHSATATGGSFDTGIFAKGGTRSATFNTAGTFSYICTPHPFMKGTVIVQAASTGTGTGDDSGDGSGTTGTDSSGTAGTTSGSTTTGPQLASTGMDVAALAILGALMCLLGVAVRRRSTDVAPRPAVPNGW